MNEVTKETNVEVGISENSQVALLFKGVTDNPVLLKFEEDAALGLASSILNALLNLKNKPVEDSIPETE